MSNIRKSFSFRDGIQVDSDDLVVRGNLVGIGTTIPTQRLDVRGTASVSGLVTASEAFVTGIGTFGKVAIGTDISITSGIVTAVAFYGDGATLSNLPTSQWQDVDVGLGFTSIYAVGNVGVGTLDPRNVFQVGSDPNEEGRQGVGINSTGDIILSGVVTAGYYYGDARYLTGITAENIEFGTINNNKLPILAEDRFPENLTLAGILTAQGGFIGTVTGKVIGDVIGIASFAYGLTAVPDIQVGVISATKIRTDSIEVLATPDAGISTVAFKFQVGVGGTGFTATDGGRIGVGTADPQADIQVLKETTDEVTTVEILNVPGESRIAIGNSVGIGNSIGVIRYGNTPGAFDLINRSTGGINYYTHTGGVSDNPGITTSGFTWIYGQTNTTLATLTYDGKFGIGKTNPSVEADVNGDVAVSQNVNILGNVDILGSLSYGSGANKVILGGGGNPIIQDANIFTTSGISTFNEVHIKGADVLGIGTDAPLYGIGLDARPAVALFAGVGIGLTSFNESFAVNGQSFFTGSVGVATDDVQASVLTPYGTNLPTDGLQVHDSVVVVNGDLILIGGGPDDPGGGIGLGTAEPFAALDMRAANYNDVRSVFYPPILRTEEKELLEEGYTLGTGAFIHELNSFSPEFYTEDYGWQPAGYIGYDNLILGNRNDTWQNFTRTAQNVNPGAGATSLTLLGSTVGRDLPADAKYSTFVGDRSGFSLTGDYNTCIGFKVGGDPNPGNSAYNYKHVVLLGCGDGTSITQSSNEDPAPPGGWSDGYHPETGAFVPPIQGSRVLGIGVNDLGVNKYWITGNQDMNVGLGISNPGSYKLYVDGNLKVDGDSYFGPTGITTFQYGINSGTIKVGDQRGGGGANVIDNTAGDLVLNSTATTNVRVQQNLNVIGNYTSTSGSLSVGGDITSTGGTTLTLGDFQTKVTTGTYNQGSTNYTFDTWSASTYKLAKYYVWAQQGSDVQVEEVLVSTDGSASDLVSGGQTVFGSQFSTIITDVSGGNVRVRFDPQPASSGSVSFKFVRQILA